MSDFIDRFEAQLVATAPRPLPLHRRAWRWVAQHAVISIAVVGVAAASSTAAALTLHGTPSKPLRGPLVSTSPGARGVAAGQYRIQIGPLPQPGVLGWCETVALLEADPHDRTAGGSCTTAPTRADYVGASSFGGSRETSMAFFMVDDRVAGLRLRNGHVVLSRADPSLPEGWRAIVVFAGDPGVGAFTNRALQHWQLLDASGGVLALGDDGEEASANGTLAKQQTPQVVDGEFPADAACRIVRTDARPWPANPISAIALRGTVDPQPGYAGRPLVSCGRLLIGSTDPISRTAMHVTAYVDATHPGARPARFPGLDGPDDGRVTEIAAGPEMPMAAGLLSGEEPTATVERRGNAWLQVDGGTEQARHALLARVRLVVHTGGAIVDPLKLPGRCPLCH